MSTWRSRLLIASLLAAIMAAGGPAGSCGSPAGRGAVAVRAAAAPGASDPSSAELMGACYLRFGERLDCVGETTEAECRRRCDELLCDDFAWLDRRPCWNWGYGG